MVKGKLYKLANLHKNKRDNILVSFAMHKSTPHLWACDGLGLAQQRPMFEDGALFVCLGAEQGRMQLLYKVLDSTGQVHSITKATRSKYFRNP